MSHVPGSPSHDKYRSHSFGRLGIHFHSAHNALDWTPDPRSLRRTRASERRTPRGTSHQRKSVPTDNYCRRHHSWRNRLQSPRRTCRRPFARTDTACDRSHRRMPSRHHRLDRNDRNLLDPTEGSRRQSRTRPFQTNSSARKSRKHMPVHSYTADHTRRNYLYQTAGLRRRHCKRRVALHTVRSTHP